jgi:hypothetical protein
MMNVSLPSSQVRTKIINNHVNNGLLANDLLDLKETQPLPEKQVDEIPMKIISEQCFYKKFVSTFLAQRNVKHDPKTKNTFIVNVPSKGKHQKEKLGPILALGEARISSIEEDDVGVGHPHMGNIKKPAPKKKKEDVGEGLLVDYALKKGRYVGTQANAQSM